MLPASAQQNTATFAVAIHPDRHQVVVAPEGEVDLATAPRIERELDELRAAGYDLIVLDLRSVTFMDSCGLRLLLRRHQAARADGWRLRLLVGGADPVRRLLEITGTMDVFDFVEGE